MTGRYDDWTEVVPGPGESAQAVAEILVRYAGADQYKVRSVRGGRSFVVHPDIAQRYTGVPRRGRRSSTRKGDDV